MLNRLSLAVLASLFTHTAHAAEAMPPEPQVLQPGETRVVLTRGGQRLYTSSVYREAEGKTRWLVRLREEPVYAAMAGARTSAARKAGTEQSARVAREQASFRKALHGLAGGKIVVRHGYRNTWNGFALTVPQGLVGALRALPEVAELYPDREVKAYDDASNAVIGAPQVWAQPGLTGQGQLIAIIDTGIDYNHPALGGGLGEGHKVVGGIDLVNADADPMDDHGHGSHVAGIAAASGPFRGVAPDAKLLAVKVLDAGGSGSSSNIIAGIEWAVDPDRNPATDDGADVINMSLGGPGDANDPMAQAANAAMRAGIVVVAAAGNAGPGYQTVGSPGTASEIVTVGATDNQDQLPSFSSRGPVLSAASLKPELLAPGVAIVSAQPGGGTQALSGTSMAAPHVAGAAALLREQHPAWSALDIKSALVTSTRDLGLEPWQQGAGRLDLPAAAKVSTSLSPSTLQFPPVDLSVTQWSQRQSVQVSNTGAQARHYRLTPNAAAQPGVTLSLEPSEFTLAAGETRQVAVHLQVDNSVARPGAGTLPTLSGSILLSGESEQLRLPYAAIHAPQLSLALDDQAWTVLVHNREGLSQLRDRPTHDSQFFLPAGEYDVQVLYLPRAELGESNLSLVQAERVQLSDHSQIRLGRELAVHTQSFDWRGEDGRVLDGDIERGITVRRKGSGIGLGYLGGTPQVQLSTISSDYEFLGSHISYHREKPHELYHDYFIHGDGISQSRSHSNDPASPRSRVDYRFDGPASVKTLSLGVGSLQHFGSYTFGVYSTCGSYRQRSWLDKEFCVLANPGLLTVFYGAQPEAFRNEFAHAYAESYVPGPRRVRSQNYIHLPLVQRAEDGLLSFYASLNEPSIYSTRSLALAWDVGRMQPIFTGRYQLQDVAKVRMTRQPYTSYFMDTAGNTAPNAPLDLLLTADGEPAQRHRIDDYFRQQSVHEYPFAPERKRAELRYDRYRVQGRQGLAKAVVEFDAAAPAEGPWDTNPPQLKELAITTAGRRATLLSRGQDNRLSALVSDEVMLKELGVEWRGASDHPWQSLPVTWQDGRLDMPLPDSLPDGHVSLRLSATDQRGNRLQYSLEPAYYLTDAADRDGDDVADNQDPLPDEPREWLDSDRDGQGDNADTDDDNDGMPDNFELAYGFDTRNPADASQDADGDGISNLDEFLQGSNPGQGQSANQAPVQTQALPHRVLRRGRTASFDVAPYFQDPDGGRLRFTAGGLPAGLSMAPDGKLSGRSRAVGSFNVVVEVSDGEASIRAPWVLKVLPI